MHCILVATRGVGRQETEIGNAALHSRRQASVWGARGSGGVGGWESSERWLWAVGRRAEWMEGQPWEKRQKGLEALALSLDKAE